MESIPVLGTAIVNAPHWLYRLYYSIDYPVDNFVVFNNNGRGQITKELDALAAIPHRFVKKVSVVHMPSNIGCSGAWNLIIKSFMQAPYWFITNHDLKYEPGFLELAHKRIQEENAGIVHGKGYSWDFFGITESAVSTCGLFDENFYPGYCEDSDYGIRANLCGVKRVDSVGGNYYHGDLMDSYDDGSQTWRSEPDIAQPIHTAHAMNRNYITMKWGSGWDIPDQLPEKDRAFGNPTMPHNFTYFDLNFNRRKHLGF